MSCRTRSATGLRESVYLLPPRGVWDHEGHWDCHLVSPQHRHCPQRHQGMYRNPDENLQIAKARRNFCSVHFSARVFSRRTCCIPLKAKTRCWSWQTLALQKRRRYITPCRRPATHRTMWVRGFFIYFLFEVCKIISGVGVVASKQKNKQTSFSVW